jgi:hypothetical protein
MNFTEILTESRTGITHIEDLVFIEGYHGALNAISTLAKIADELGVGSQQVAGLTVKWDGSPAIFAGIDPSDGKFFVGTKSAFAKKVPKRIKRLSDIRRFYGDEGMEDLARKLEAAFTHLRRLRFDTVMQGDLMFTQDDLKTATIDGERFLIFKPNTIVYAVPQGSKLANEIASKEIGIVWHTKWEGDSLETMTPSPAGRVDLGSDPKIWQEDATYKNYTGIANLSKAEYARVQKLLHAATELVQSIGSGGFHNVLANKEFKNIILPFVNARIRSGKHAGKPQAFMNEFLEFYKEKQLAGADDLAEPYQAKRHAKIEQKLRFVREHKDTIYKIVQLYDVLNTLKLTLFKKLSRIDSMRTFKQTDGGFEVTNPEGFVAMSENGVVKLVDRLEFSRLNFMKN